MGRHLLPPHSFHGLDVGRGHCGLTLMILFLLSIKLFLIFIEKKLWIKNYIGGMVSNIIESKVAKGWVIFDEN